jgi:hypothetical protein
MPPAMRGPPRCEAELEGSDQGDEVRGSCGVGTRCHGNRFRRLRRGGGRPEREGGRGRY